MNIEQLNDRLLEAAREAGFTLHPYGAIGEFSLHAFTRKSKHPKSRIYLSSGVHGDEPAGPLTLLDLLRRKTLSPEVDWTIVPLVNPQGFVAGTRENHQQVDINRDFGPNPTTGEARLLQQWIGDRSFDLTICVHEDYEGEGYYLYHHNRRKVPLDYASKVLEAARPHCRIDERTEIDGLPASQGQVLPPPEVLEDFGDSLPEALWLLREHTSLCYTLESPSGHNIVSRIEAHKAAIQQLVKQMLETSSSSS